MRDRGAISRRVFAVMTGVSLFLSVQQVYGNAAMWDTIQSLYQTPTSTGMSGTTIKAIQFKGLSYCGNTNFMVDAWFGAPSNASAANKVPAVVFVHGGGCWSSSSDTNANMQLKWIYAFVRQGFAAIAYSADYDDCSPPSSNPRYAGLFYAIANGMAANSLMRSLTFVDTSKIGVCGLSWGGHKSCILSSVDKRFKYAITVYGSGYMEDEPEWNRQIFSQLSPADSVNWVAWFDPASYLGNTTMPMLWLTGISDNFWGQATYRRSYRLVKGPRTIAVSRDLSHDCAEPLVPDDMVQDEPFIFAKSIVSNGIPLPKITDQGVSGTTAFLHYQSTNAIVTATFNYTTSTADNSHTWTWADPVNATITSSENKVSATIPSNAARYYFELRDTRGNALVTSEYVDKFKGETGATATIGAARGIGVAMMKTPGRQRLFDIRGRQLPRAAVSRLSIPEIHGILVREETSGSPGQGSYRLAVR